MPYCHFILGEEKVFTESTPVGAPWDNIRLMCRYCGCSYGEIFLQRRTWFFHSGYCAECDPVDGGSFFSKRLGPQWSKLLPKAILLRELELELSRHGEVL
jgi:hypothetical protein